MDGSEFGPLIIWISVLSLILFGPMWTDGGFWRKWKPLWGTPDLTDIVRRRPWRRAELAPASRAEAQPPLPLDHAA